MNLNKDGSFNANAKIISEEESNKMIEYTKKIIEKTTNNILEAKFDINPKFYNGENISCKYCSYKDICYMKEKDLVYLDKVENLNFLDGGEENA
jgi:ATP-dependent helicase/DNAse subunit B